MGRIYEAKARVIVWESLTYKSNEPSSFQVSPFHHHLSHHYCSHYLTMSKQILKEDPVQERVEMLQRKKLETPSQSDNIDAVIRFYQEGGELPTFDKMVYALEGKVTRSTIQEFAGYESPRDQGFAVL